jgi:hypothetical protein
MATGRPQNRGHKQKPRQPQLKHDCGCGLFIYMPWKQTRLASETGGHVCGECGGRFIPANFEDCQEFAPALVHLHGDYVEPPVKMDTPQWGTGHGEGYCECSYAKPENAHPDHWYCPKCRKVNERQADGTMIASHALPFGVERERANGLASQSYAEKASSKAPEPDTYRDTNPDIPF